MAFTGVLGSADSRPGNMVLGDGDVIHVGNPNAFGALTFTDAASVIRQLPNFVSVSASDSARFSDQASVSPASQTVVGWISPEQSTRFKAWPSTQPMFGGFYVTPNDMLGVCVYNSTVEFDLVLSDEYDGSDLLIRLWWTGSSSAAWSGTVDAYIYAVSKSDSTFSVLAALPSDPHWHAGPVSISFPSGVWTLCETSLVMSASGAPFPLVAGQAYIVAFTVIPASGQSPSFGSMPVPFLLLGVEIQNK